MDMPQKMNLGDSDEKYFDLSDNPSKEQSKGLRFYDEYRRSNPDDKEKKIKSSQVRSLKEYTSD
jgi:hypothetical protein